MASFPSTLVTQNAHVDSVALGTLAEEASISIDSSFGSISATFLAKRVRYFLRIRNIDGLDGALVVGLGHGNASAAEAATALTHANTTGPQNLTAMLAEDNAWTQVQNSIEFLKFGGIFTADSKYNLQSSGEWHSLGKGIPFSEGTGWQAWITNVGGSALATGVIVEGQIQVQGVWLRD